MWGPSDVYQVDALPSDARVLMHGMVLTGMQADDPPNLAKSAMPLVWTRDHERFEGKRAKALCSTIGSAVDLQSEDLRRLVVNGCYWLLGMEDEISERTNVDYVDDFQPTFFGRDAFIPSRTPDDYRLKSE